jgi:hypothetical protein
VRYTAGVNPAWVIAGDLHLALLRSESRMLQVTIFQILQDNLASIDFSVLLIGVMTIADEIDSQLSQAMESYLMQST